MVRAGDIYLVQGTHLGICTDARPSLVLTTYGDTALVCVLSAQFDCADGNEIALLKSDPEFRESGLKQNSFIPNTSDQEVALSALEISPRLGRASGEFKRKVEAFFGLSF